MRRAADALRAEGRVLEAARHLHADAEAADADPHVRSRLFRDAAVATGSVDEWAYARLLAERARYTSWLAGTADPLLDALAAAVELQLGHPVAPQAPAAVPRHDRDDWDAALSIVDWAVEAAPDPQPWLAVVDAAVDDAGRTGDDAVRLRALLSRGPLLALEFDEWQRAREDLAGAVRLARALRDPFSEGAALFALAGQDALSGNERRCREQIARVATLWEPALAPGRPTFHLLALGNLELTLGRPERTIGYLEPAVTELQAPSTSAHALLVEAYAKAGRQDQARRIAARLGPTARRRSAAAVDRALALVAPAGEAEERYASLLSRRLPPYVRARAELDYGERLRRSKRRRDARDHLQAALEIFERLGALPWAERARDELAASGVRRDNGRGRLTVQETRVADLVAEGATNVEVAGMLFVTQNTVEFHLKNVFRKLDVRSRTELARRLRG